MTSMIWTRRAFLDEVQQKIRRLEYLRGEAVRAGREPGEVHLTLPDGTTAVLSAAPGQPHPAWIFLDRLYEMRAELFGNVNKPTLN
jgi:hypothetical protein